MSYFSKEDVEKCKQKDLLEQTMSEMIGEFHALHQTIVAERDIYLTHTLRQATCCVEAPSNAQSMYYNAQQASSGIYCMVLISSYRCFPLSLLFYIFAYYVYGLIFIHIHSINISMYYIVYSIRGFQCTLLVRI